MKVQIILVCLILATAVLARPGRHHFPHMHQRCLEKAEKLDQYLVYHPDVTVTELEKILIDSCDGRERCAKFMNNHASVIAKKVLVEHIQPADLCKEMPHFHEGRPGFPKGRHDCVVIVEALVSHIPKGATGKEIMTELNTFCEAHPLGGRCTHWVEVHGAAFVQVLETGERDPEVICKAMHETAAQMGRPNVEVDPTPGRGMGRGMGGGRGMGRRLGANGQGRMPTRNVNEPLFAPVPEEDTKCVICTDLAAVVMRLLPQDPTEDHVVHILDRLCKLDIGHRDNCMAWVEEHGIEITELILKGEQDPALLCEALNEC